MSFHTIISGEWLRKGNASDKKGMRQRDNEKGRGKHMKGEEEEDKTQEGLDPRPHYSKSTSVHFMENRVPLCRSDISAKVLIQAFSWATVVPPYL